MRAVDWMKISFGMRYISLEQLS
ncbi:protein of unknown function [Cupriavidus taiwanensis]|uniref:Uncharacterized protein n=1 Tax=Cupriavidus taiwanensis TaxID=164546 RepID=A0A7Z7JF46_9BURK|nr:protein of unknown function [Cupriavidus taiwanensis]SOZ43341.1 protein of unknown function [Cupriavidus taiwanensis]SPC22584.1 protein of unknown function [Cupriavidus taiwanensis]